MPTTAVCWPTDDVFVFVQGTPVLVLVVHERSTKRSFFVSLNYYIYIDILYIY